MLDPHDAHDSFFVINAVNDPVRTTTRSPVSLQLPLQRLPDLFGTVQHGTHQELCDCNGDPMRESSERPLR